MDPLSLSTLAAMSGASLLAGNPAVLALRVSKDTRALQPGDLYVALRGERFDGNHYIAEAAAKGAVAALCDEEAPVGLPHDFGILSTPDALTGLTLLASSWRERLGLRSVVITGSSGKTTARSFIAAVLKQKLTVGETSGNLNNHIGVPISLLRFNGTEDIGLIEMGANHEKEIHLLSKIAKPTIGIVTNVGYAHIGYFGSLAAIARTKLEIVDGMSGKSGFLLLNGDEPMLINAARGIRNNTVYFGFSRRCHVRARNARVADGAMTFEVDGEEYRLAMPGRHFIYSALLAIHLGVHFGVQRRRIAGALESLRPVALRGTIEKKSGITFIVDCYNANQS